MVTETGSITIHNVARVAGVSISTVSRVVNGLGRVAPDTRRKVETAIRHLDFHPNSRAQALSRRRTDTIGLIVPDFEGQYFAMLMEGAHEEAQANGVHIMVLKAKGAESQIEAVSRLCSEGRTDGVILMLSELYDEVLEGVGNINGPLVILDKDVNLWRLDNILLDNHLGAFEVTRHFIDVHGITNVFFVGGSEHNVDTTARARGFTDALASIKVTADDKKFFGNNYSYDEGYRLTQEKIFPLIKPQERYGIVAGNDDIACGVIDALMDKGIKVPQQVGVAGFDDSDIAIHRRLKLTTMRIPTKEIGRVAVRMILNRISGQTTEPAKVVLKARLIVRDSCGCGRADS
ncbi:MAG: LacI family DNA-binding transcriptional regulator [Phycisphaerae bacterium]|jgi:LacI family transcriptional regulator